MAIIDYLPAAQAKVAAQQAKADQRRDAVKGYITTSFQNAAEDVRNGKSSTEKRIARALATQQGFPIGLDSIKPEKTVLDRLRNVWTIDAHRIRMDEVTADDVLANAGFQELKGVLAEKSVEITSVELERNYVPRAGHFVNAVLMLKLK